MGIENIILQKEPAKICIAGRMELTYSRHAAVFVDLGEVRALDTVGSTSELPEFNIVGNAKGF